MPDTAFYSRLMIGMKDREVALLVNLASAQLVLEELKQKDPVIGPAIERPEDAADAASLRSLLEAGRLRGVQPDDSTLEANVLAIKDGWYFTNGDEVPAGEERGADDEDGA